MTLLQIAFLLFAAVAAGGLLMALMLAMKARIPALIATGHGLAGLASVALLFVANLRGGETTPALAWWALGVFTGGLIGGLLLFRVLFKDRATLGLAAVHGSVGGLGLYLLYQAAF
ncbi:MAG: hypothetical protein V4650_00800 [Pseudomonadota bacterium]